MYGYITWDIILGLCWLLLYSFQKNIRSKILWGSIIALPFGFGELYFIPNYWIPQTLFNFGIKYHLAIESFLVMFFLGGLAAAVYEAALQKYKMHHPKCCGNICFCYLSLGVALASFIILLKTFPLLNIIYSSILACFIGGIFAFFVYPELRSHIFLGGLFFMFLYGITLFVSEILVPGWIAATWNLSLISGVVLFKIPLEELLFGFAFGTLWSPLYEEICSNFKVK
ncbi:MAG: lycopene cyclase domain-containing protein [Nanoarchaeota archaeon]